MLVFLNAWLITRLWFTFRDEPLPIRQWLILGLVQVLLVALLEPGLHSIILPVAVIASIVIPEYFFPPKRINEARLAGALIVLVISFGIALSGNPETWVMSRQALNETTPFLLGLFGFLLVANESNLAIRTLLHRFHMEPTTGSDRDSQTLDDREYNAGRVIGMLERWLIYMIVVLTQNYNVIALILAAKGVARFRQMEEREFAEYVLIGTLGSILLTVMIGQLVISLSS